MCRIDLPFYIHNWFQLTTLETTISELKASNEELKANLDSVEDENLDLQAKIKQQGKNFKIRQPFIALHIGEGGGGGVEFIGFRKELKTIDVPVGTYLL